MEALRVVALSKNFGGVQALQDASFSVEEGEHLAIIGPNGAGKTTLFNVLSGQIPGTSGQIYLFGKEISDMPEHRRAHLGLARSFQTTSLFFNLAVLDNALLALQGMRPCRFQMYRPITAYGDLFTKARELLGFMDLWEKRDVPVHSISYGEQRKLEIALALATEPKLLLLDEPSTGLTITETADLTNLIANMSSQITVVIVAHDMDLVFGVADRIIVLHYGRILAEGTPQEIQNDSTVKEIYMGDQNAQVDT